MTPTPPSAQEPVAIIGMGCRLPGNITTPDLLWRALIQGRDCVTRIPENRWKTMVDHLHPDQVPTEPFPAGVVDTDAFDREFFGITADEAQEMDPQQKMLLETVYETLADASLRPDRLAGSPTGVYVGAASIDQAALNFGIGHRAGVHTGSGAGMAILANRISYRLDTQGPSLTLDTACSSSLTALHYAVRDLRSGAIDTAIVAGANVLTSPVITASFIEAGVLAPNGRCKPFDAQSDGYVRSEGAVVLVLTRAGTADERGHRVWAQVAGTAIGHGGTSPHLLAPRVERQTAVIRQALGDANTDPDRVGWVQTHGTGTRAGDRIEATALAQALGRDAPIPVGSVKSNLGHLEGAAGALGVMAAALAVHHGQIPPTLHHRALRPRLEGQVRVPTSVEGWPDTGHEGSGARVAGVSSFGFGGANAHAIITQAPAPEPPSAQDPMPLPETVVVSAHSASALTRTAAHMADHTPRGRSVGTVADTALAHSTHHRHRAAVVASDLGGLIQGLRHIQDGTPSPDVVSPALAPTARPRLVFVYTGHGGHHPDAGAELMRLPAFAQALGEARTELEQQTGQGVWKPGEAISGFVDAQHCTYLVQVGLTALLAYHGIVPDAVLGHSVGEIAATHTAGVLSPEMAARVLAHRSSLLSGLSQEGGLLAVRASTADLGAFTALYVGRVTLASYSAPRVQVVAGPAADLDSLEADLTAQRVWCRRVRDVIPAHSPFVDPVVAPLREELAGLVPRPAQVPVVSTAHPHLPPGTPQLWTPVYWADQARQPVRFTDALSRALALVEGEDEPVVFVEVGPRALLAEHITHTVGVRYPTVAATTDPSGFAYAIGELYTHGVVPSGPTRRAHPSLVLLPSWDRPQQAPARNGGPEPIPSPAPEEVRAHLAAEVARVTHLPEGVDLSSSWADLGLESHQLLQLTSRLRLVHAWKDVDIQIFLPQRPLSQVADDLQALLRSPAPASAKRWSTFSP